VKPLVGKQVEPRSVLGEEDSTVPSEAIAVVICGSLESAGSGDVTSLSGGAFSQSRRGSFRSQKSVRAPGARLPGRRASAPRPRHDGRSYASAGCVTRSPAHRSVKSGGSSETMAKGVEYFPQVGNNLWKSPGPRAGSSRSDRWKARLRPCPRWCLNKATPVHRWKAPRVRRVSPFFAEGRETRPWVPGVSAQATHREQRPSVHSARRAPESRCRRLRASGVVGGP
jgi:hypothetical protein